MTSIFVAADAILGATTIRQVTQTDHQTNQEHRKAMTSGGNTIAQISGKSAAEVSTLTSGDLAALLGLNTGTFVSAGLSLLASTVTIPYKLRANGATFQSGASHPQITGSNALIIPVSIEASAEDDYAKVNCEIHWLSTDGKTKGAGDAMNQALVAQSFNAEFTLCDTYINGSVIPGVQSFRATTGLEVVKPPKGGCTIWPTFASIKSKIPTMEITVNDFDAIASTVGDFTEMTSANQYFKKRNDGGVFVADATAEHCRLTFAGGVTDTSSVSVSENEDGSATIMLHGKVMTANAATAIP